MRREGRYVDVEQAAELLRAGELVILPTETVYGLAARADDPAAVARIFAAKERPSFNPLICHLSSAEEVFRYGRPSPVARALAERFWPGPLTLLLPHEGRIPGIVTAGSAHCAFRVPDHTLTLDVLQRVAVPVAAPSANLSGRLSPTSASSAEEQLGQRVGGILDGGPAGLGLESTVVHVNEQDQLSVLRPGGVTVEDLRGAGFQVSRVQSNEPSAPEGARELRAPGNTLVHYAPRRPMVFLEHNASATAPTLTQIKQLLAPLDLETVGLQAIAFERVVPGLSTAVLAPDGDLATAAQSLFALLHQLENEANDVVLAFGLPGHGLGVAINDRLRRGSVATISLDEQGAWKLERR